MSTLRPDYPAGPYIAEHDPSPERRREFIAELETFPANLRKQIAELRPALLDARYKLWTVRQIVHHLADSHLNAYVRTKLALTEECPTIKPYDESAWSQLPDATKLDPEVSLKILDGVHQRWAKALETLTDADFQRAYFHPELQRPVQLAEMIGLYAWHGRHHSMMIAWVAIHAEQS